VKPVSAPPRLRQAKLWFAALLPLLAIAGPVVAAPIEYDIAVRLDPVARTLEGRSVISVSDRQEHTLALGRRFDLTKAQLDGRPLGPGAETGALRTWSISPGPGTPRRIEIEWRGTLTPLDTTLSHGDTLGANEPVAGEQGSFLPDSSNWYPQIEGVLAPYRLSLDLPQGQRGLVPGRLLDESDTGGRYRASFEFPFPSNGIDLMAGPYRVETRSMSGAGGKTIRLRTYFHPQIADLAPAYLESVRGYLELYESWIGEYPFSEFSVVSSPTPTGFGMPTLTYLGIEVLRLPFIRATSLGHEVLHNWWGNGVYPDYARGNWSEGLTTFMADYAYKERESPEAARDMRLSWLRDFAAVPAGQDRPLAEFTSRTHGTSQIVGYNKAAMMFFMLRDQVGRAAFDRGIREFWNTQRFRVASWAELRRAFENASGQDLGPFFDQWLNRPGAPSVRIAEAASGPAGAGGAPGGAGYSMTVSLAQSAPAYSLRVPVAIRTERGDETRYLNLDRAQQTFSVELPARPLELALDPDLRLFRRLAPAEAPPILRQVMVDAATLTVLLPADGEARDAARSLAEKLQDQAPRTVSGAVPLPPAPVLAIGLHDEVDAWLARNGQPPRPEPVRGKGTAQAWTATRPDGSTLAVVSARDAASLAALARPLPHYGRQSWIVFEGEKVIERGTWSAKVQSVKLP
jgi:aminopeptidase N